MTDPTNVSEPAPVLTGSPSDRSAADRGSRTEAVAAVVHHHHHPADANAGVLRARPGRGAAPAAVLAAAVTVLAVVLLALAIGGQS